MRISWKTEWLNWALIAGMFLLTAFIWDATPARSQPGQSFDPLLQL